MKCQEQCQRWIAGKGAVVAISVAFAVDASLRFHSSSISKRLKTLPSSPAFSGRGMEQGARYINKPETK
ncbi:hypothetical protein PHLCEN_2v11490 [Hermanssonia centrifuga]|uniref:Uncharacterized protein n=1 Tax=Hermanssonia centrifuga TaxID=98765 RepID=A0A2R6NJW3_9APHY|nr:hypothetical protein PHLCEN_2v11490 [Hermanssonia centrifuga]